MGKQRLLFALLLPLLTCMFCAQGPEVSGELKTWHRIRLSFAGPETGEAAMPNPFMDYRLDVTFTQGEQSFTVPGFFAADGNAAETSATEGNIWRVYFTPNAAGEWRYTVSFRTGDKVAISDDPSAGQPTAFDGASGMFVVTDTDKTPPDVRGNGALQYVGEHYLKFAESGRYFLKGGADSPENFLAYYEFDAAERIASGGEAREGEAQKILQQGSHKYEPHANDWQQGDPTWQNGKGKNIIGALNYLASEKMNSVYFLTMNVGGDGKDVWPWTSYDERYRYDCSKLAQWEIVLSHMDELGLMQHVVLTETENEALFEVDEGVSTNDGFADSRKLYYRELVARFGHHPALVWNLGEENGWDNEDVKYGAANSDAQRKMFSTFLRGIDPYNHPIVVHTLPGRYDEIYTPLLGHPAIEGPSLQMGNQQNVHQETLKWLLRSAMAGRPWFVCLDEIGPAHTGVKPDEEDYEHNEVRRYSLWGNLMAGGSGCEWYFGYRYPHNDLNLEDWRSRDHMWDLTRYALEFFQQNLPFWDMQSQDELTPEENDYCLAKPGELYAVYLPESGSNQIDVPQGSYSVLWYNPRSGGELQTGSLKSLSGPGVVSFGAPPKDADQDWVVLIKNK